MNRSKRPAALLLSIGLLFTALPAAYAAPAVSYSEDTGLSSLDRTPRLKAAWTAQTDIGSASNSGTYYARTAGSLVFYPSGGKLVAVDAATGRMKWSRPAKLSSEIITGSGTLYYTDTSGTLYRVDPKTGRTVWKTKTGIDTANRLVTSALAGGTLYVSGPLSLHAYDPATGRKLWKQPTEGEFAGARIYGVYGGVLLTSAEVSGATMVDQYSGYNPKSGKKLWTLAGSHGPLLDYRSGMLYLRNISLFASRDHAAVLDKVDVRTGKVLSSFSYVEVEDGTFQQANQLIIDGKYLYIAMQKYRSGVLQGYEDVVYRYDLERDPAVQKPVLYEGEGRFLAGPYMGRMFFQNGSTLRFMKFAGRASSSYNGLSNSVARLDLKGTGAYAGLANGSFYLIDIPSSKTVGRIDTGAWNYGETLLAKNMVIIQAENKLIAIEQPRMAKP